MSFRSLKALLRPFYHNCVRKPLKQVVPPLLRRLPFSSRIIGPPKSTLTTPQWAARYNQSHSSAPATYYPIHAAQTILRHVPQTLCHPLHVEFEEREVSVPETFVATMPQGRIWSSEGVVVTPDDILLEDVSIEYENERFIPGKHSIFTQVKLPRVHVVDGTVAVLTTLSQSYYSHWMMDVLPRIELIRQSNVALDEVDWFYLPGCDHSHQRETLQQLGISLEKVLDSRLYPHVEARRLVVPSLVGKVGGVRRPTQWMCEFLRQNFSCTPNAEAPERLYISRANTHHRRVLNEDELLCYLQELGFVVVEPETLSITEQAALFAGAKIIVTPLGSAMTNMVFCNPGTKIIEFFNPNCVHRCTWALCNQIGLDYYYLVGQDIDRDKHPTEADIILDMTLLKKTLALAGVV